MKDETSSAKPELQLSDEARLRAALQEAVQNARCGDVVILKPGVTIVPDNTPTVKLFTREELDAAVAAERERCARLAESKCDEWTEEGDGESLLASQQLYGRADAGREIAAAIRARWKTNMICEEHTDQPWPHDDCSGPGMLPTKPPST